MGNRKQQGEQKLVLGNLALVSPCSRQTALSVLATRIPSVHATRCLQTYLLQTYLNPQLGCMAHCVWLINIGSVTSSGALSNTYSYMPVSSWRDQVMPSKQTASGSNGSIIQLASQSHVWRVLSSRAVCQGVESMKHAFLH